MVEKGYVDEPVDEFTDLKKEIDKLRKEKMRLFWDTTTRPMKFRK